MNNERSSKTNKETGWLFRAIAFAWVALVSLLLLKIGTSSMQIGTPITESEAIVRTNERMLGMVQWTISTILLVGGGLIGLNWYQNEKRHQIDLERMQNRTEELSRKMERTESLVKLTSDFLVEKHIETKGELFEIRNEMRQTTLSFFGYGESLDEGAALIKMLDQNPNNQPFVLSYIEKFITKLEKTDPSSSFLWWLDGRSLGELAKRVGEAGHFELENRISKLNQQYESHKPNASRIKTQQ